MSKGHGGPAAVVARFAVAIYLVAFLCMLAPPLDLVFSLPSIDVSSVRWRFGAVGLITGAAVFPLVGLLLALITAVVCGHRWMYRTLVGLGVAGAVLLILAVGLFTLDSLQVRPDVTAEALRRFDLTVVKAIITQLVQVVVLTVVLWTAVRAWRAVGTRHPVVSGDAMLVAPLKERSGS